METTMEDLIQFTMNDLLYEELFATEADSYDDEKDPPIAQQFAKALITAKQGNGFWIVEMTPDIQEHFFHNVLLPNMEMWDTWGDDGLELIVYARTLLSNAEISCPY